MGPDFDVVIIGSGFAGALAAMIARRLGWRALLLERGTHPRFAIGESSTPLAALLLESLAIKYDLPRLLPLAKWGAWQSAYPKIGCGLKRGFTFYHHRIGAEWQPLPDRSNELLVAASPNDRISDTHWYRPDFDHFLVREAIDLGVCYQDRIELKEWDRGPLAHRLSGVQNGREVAFSARFLVDATGPRGFVHRQLGLTGSKFDDFPETEAVFAHFHNVARWDDLFAESVRGAPYNPDDAAVHHVFEGGWMWALRFNNAITSAGFALLSRDKEVSDDGPELIWKDRLSKLPTVGALFQNALPATPIYKAPRLSFRGNLAVGDRFVLLPGATGFVDPLLSTGLPLSLLGVERIARLWEQMPGDRDWTLYERETFGDLDATAALVGALYRNLANPPAFQSLTMLYFAAASYAETAQRLGKPGLAPGFMLRDHAWFGPRMRDCVQLAGRIPNSEFGPKVCAAIDPINIAGLADESKRNWYPARAEDLLAGAGKLHSPETEIRAMLRKTGFQD